jgi:hypothetical protein
LTNISRLTASRLYEVRYQLTPAAFDIINTLAIVRVATGQQIARLHFTTGTSLSRVRMRNLTLRRMTELGVLVRWRKPSGGLSGGSDAYCYALDRAGQMLAFPDKPYYWREPYPNASFLQHRLAVTEVYVSCQEDRGDGVTLARYEPEPDCWRKIPSSYGGKGQTLRPDAFLELLDGSRLRPRFIEVDMGTELLERIGDKLKQYYDYWQLEWRWNRQEQRGTFPRVVFLVPDEARRQRLAIYLRKAVPKLASSAMNNVFTVELQANAYTCLKSAINGLPPEWNS